MQQPDSGGSDAVVCPSCQATNPPDARFCRQCERCLVVGKLTSLGAGVLTKGFAWELRPKPMTLGRHVGNDFVIPSNLVAGEQLRFTFSDGGFAVSDVAGTGNCLCNQQTIARDLRLSDGDVLQVGVEQLQYQDVPPSAEKATGASYPLTEQLQLMLGLVAELHASLNLQELLDNAVDAVLRLTRLERGFAFFLEESEHGEDRLREVSARAGGGRPLVEPDAGAHTIGQTVMQRVFRGDGAVYVEDAGAERPPGAESEGPRLRSIVCVPLVTFHPRTGRKQVRGVIYADALAPARELPRHCRPSLQMLAHVITSIMARWQNHERAECFAQNCQRSLKALRNDVAEVMDRLQLLRQQVGEVDRVNRLTPDEIRLGLETMLARLETMRISLQGLHYPGPGRG